MLKSFLYSTDTSTVVGCFGSGHTTSLAILLNVSLFQTLFIKNVKVFCITSQAVDKWIILNLHSMHVLLFITTHFIPLSLSYFSLSLSLSLSLLFFSFTKSLSLCITTCLSLYFLKFYYCNFFLSLTFLHITIINFFPFLSLTFFCHAFFICLSIVRSNFK